MKRSSLWREFESGGGFLLQALRFLILAGGLLFLSFSGTLSLSWENQFALAALTLAAAIWMNSASKSHAVTLTLVLLSVYSTFRYAFWRISTAALFFRDPGTHWTTLDAVFIGMLLLAEAYACVVLVLGYVQVLWPLRRAPVPLPDDPKYWPAVDLLIPTFDEPLSVVRFTALAAMNIDWPADKLHVYILDDGGREEFREFAEEAGIGYMSRDDRRHAKAGNINHALAQLDSPFVAVFDCDHVPTRSFLQVTMGWLLRDQKLAMLQTPHHFYSPDPFERNLDQFRAIPSEDELYYGVVQDGNDFWNATCFCGSCAVLRRSALDEVGGVAVETLTEDAHTSVRLQRSGWNTAYINIPQAAGLATERLSAHIRQRVRWARGMVQILRTENPLFASGLNPAQRLCYFNAMLHFLFALPRLIFLVAPLIYLVFGRTSIPGFWAAIVAYAIPHLLLAHVTHSRIQGAHRHSFWNEIYETVLAPYILLPTLFALISPRSGKFQVTAKGGVVDQGYFDARIARPFLVLLALNFVGLLCAVARCVRFPTFTVSRGLSLVNWPAHLYDGHHFGIVAVNVAWALFNMTILGVAVGVSRETQQRRQSVRVSMAVPSDVILADGTMIQGSTADLSSGGVRTHVDRGLQAKVGDSIRFVFPLLDGTATLPATVVAVDGSELRARFDHLSLQEDEALTMLLYSRADSWLACGKTREADNPLRSLARIFRLSLRGLAMAVGGTRGPRNPSHTSLATSITPFLLIAGLAGVSLRVARAAQDSGAASKPPMASASRSAALTSTANFDTFFTLADAGAPSTIALRGVDGSRSIVFSVPRNRLVKAATLKLRYRFSPGLLPGISQLNVSLNGAQFATLAVKAPSTNTAEQGDTLEAALKLPAESLAADNQLTFEFIGHYALQCEDPSNSTLWSQIDSSSTLELAGTQAPPGSDLSALPQSFLGSGVNPSPTVPIVFLTQPSPTAMQAAGVIASWFGIQNSARPLRFPVSIGTIPAGNVIVIAEHPSQLPPSLGPAFVEAAVAIRPNPSDPYSSVLLVTGDGADQVLTAARALALHEDTWQGPQVGIQSLTLPAPRQPDDAPRWLSTDKHNVATVGQIAQSGAKSAGVTDDLQGDGSAPLSLTFRLPPDLDYGDRENLAFHMSYRYNGVPLVAGSTLQVFMNGNFVSSTPMPHTDKASAVLETVVPIPVVDLRPFANTMTFKFMFQAAKAGGCANGVPTNMQAAILKDSYLDIAGIPHSVTLPNLELFANAGYPFTRRADLSDTMVVLPDQPSAAELEMFLAMMGHFGTQTGYPALNLTLTNAAGMTRDGSRDYLVLGTVEDQPALKSLDAYLPVGEDEGGLHIRDTRGFFGRAAWWRSSETNVAQQGQIATGGGLPDALIEELQWPTASNRSVVTVVLRDADSVPNFLSAFLTTSQSPEIAESVSVLHGSRFSSYRIGRDVYRVGEVASLAPLARALQSFPWLIAGMTLLLCFLMAVLIQARLRRHARTRLKAAE